MEETAFPSIVLDRVCFMSVNEAGQFLKETINF